MADGEVRAQGVFNNTENDGMRRGLDTYWVFCFRVHHGIMTDPVPIAKTRALLIMPYGYGQRVQIF